MEIIESQDPGNNITSAAHYHKSCHRNKLYSEINIISKSAYKNDAEAAYAKAESDVYADSSAFIRNEMLLDKRIVLVATSSRRF